MPVIYLSAPGPLAVESERVPATGSATADATGRRPAKLAGTRTSRASLFRAAQTIIQRDYGKDLAVEALARRVLASRRQLQRAFTDAGTTVRAELRATRMQRAAELLIDSTLTVRDVASQVGYQHPAHFAHAFHQRHGITPTQYRTADTPQPELRRNRHPRPDTAPTSRPATSSPPARPDPPR